MLTKFSLFYPFSLFSNWPHGVLNKSDKKRLIQSPAALLVKRQIITGRINREIYLFFIYSDQLLLKSLVHMVNQ